MEIEDAIEIKKMVDDLNYLHRQLRSIIELSNLKGHDFIEIITITGDKLKLPKNLMNEALKNSARHFAIEVEKVTDKLKNL